MRESWTPAHIRRYLHGYTLTCERPDGTVLQTATVTVDRGGTKKLDLKDCQRRFRG